MIAFVRHHHADQRTALVVMDANGSGVSVVVPFIERPITGPAWSPDGSTIAFCAQHGRRSAVYTVNTDGSALTKLSPEGRNDCDPVWSPDGASIAVDTYPSDGTFRTRLAVMNADGTGRQVILGTGYNFFPDWSPDGTALVFSRGLGNGFGDYDVFTVDVDGSNLTDITNSPHRSEWTPAFSPSGTWIVYPREQAESNAAPDDLWIRSSDGTGRPHRLTDTRHSDEWNPSWQPQ
jgi:TolB protein